MMDLWGWPELGTVFRGWWWWWCGGGGGGVVGAWVLVVVELVFVIWIVLFFVSFVALLAVKMDVRYGSSSPPNRMNYYGNYK